MLFARSARTLCRAAIPLLVLSCFLSRASAAEPSTTRPAPRKASELLQETAVWTVHLKFTADQWAAMEPKQGARPAFGGPRDRGPGAFGPAMILAPAFIKDGDGNQDGKLSKDEFAALGAKWFADWDKGKTGKLDLDQLGAGLNTALEGVGPGGPGGPGPRLQGAEGKRNGLASASGLEFDYVHADLEFQGWLMKDVGVRYKGNGTFMQSRNTVKRSLKISIDHFAKGRTFAGLQKINLHNNVTDASWMNEVLSHKLFRDAGVPAPRSSYARVYVTVPGKFDKLYFGLYSIVEDIDKTFMKERGQPKGGAVFKPVTPDLFADLGDDWAKYNQSYDPKTDLTDAQKRRVIEFSRLLTRADDAEFAAKAGDYLDFEEFARFMAVTTWLSTMDSILALGQNFYVYLDPKTNKFQFLPWDLDHSFGQFPMGGSQEQREQLSIQRPWRGANRFLERVYKVAAFKRLYLARMEEFSKTIFVPERFNKQVDAFAAAIRPAVREESTAKLARFERAVAGESPDAGAFGMRFGPAVKPIKGFVKPRAQSVIDQLSGTATGQVLDDFGPGGRGGRDGRGGGPGGRGGFGPGNMFAGGFMTALDANRDGQLSREEFVNGFDKWFVAWNTDKSGLLTDEQLRAGINKDMMPQRGGNFRGGGFGPPGGGPGGPGGPPLMPPQ